MAERPEPVGAVAGRAIGDAGLAQVAVGHGKAPLDLVGRERAEGIEEAGPDRARGAVRTEELVGNAGQTAIVADPLRNAALAGRSARLASPLCCALAHAPLPAPPPYSLQEWRSQVECQRKLICAFLRRRPDRARRMGVVRDAHQPTRIGLVG